MVEVNASEESKEVEVSLQISIRSNEILESEDVNFVDDHSIPEEMQDSYYVYQAKLIDTMVKD